jgi:aspartate ammonia-lyase
VEHSLAMATALAPRIGYDRAAEIAKASVESGRSVRELCLERGVLPPDELAALLDPLAQTGR